MSAYKTERNAQVWEDKKTMSWREMVIKYNMDEKNLRLIVKTENKRRLARLEEEDRKRKLELGK
jgi:hypothetical protein